MTFEQQMHTLRAMADDIQSRHGPENGEVIALRAAMDALKGTQGYAQQHEADEQTIRVMRAEIRLHRQKRDGEYWAWTGDPKEDNVESLTCPVLVPIDTVRKWLSAAGERMKKPGTALIEALKAAGVEHNVTPPAVGGVQWQIEVCDEQDSGQGVIIYFNNNADGSESFVCQE